MSDTKACVWAWYRSLLAGPLRASTKLVAFAIADGARMIDDEAAADAHAPLPTTARGRWALWKSPATLGAEVGIGERAAQACVAELASDLRLEVLDRRGERRCAVLVLVLDSQESAQTHNGAFGVVTAASAAQDLGQTHNGAFEPNARIRDSKRTPVRSTPYSDPKRDPIYTGEGGGDQLARARPADVAAPPARVETEGQRLSLDAETIRQVAERSFKAAGEIAPRDVRALPAGKHWIELVAPMREVAEHRSVTIDVAAQQLMLGFLANRRAKSHGFPIPWLAENPGQYLGGYREPSTAHKRMTDDEFAQQLDSVFGPDTTTRAEPGDVHTLVHQIPLIEPKPKPLRTAENERPQLASIRRAEAPDPTRGSLRGSLTRLVLVPHVAARTAREGTP